MLRTLELLALAKQRESNCSDYRLAQLLGINQSTLIAYRRGRARPANAVAARLGALCGLDPSAVVLWVNIERSGTPDDRETWLRILERIEGTEPPKMAA